jgi:hypothetical protein
MTALQWDVVGERFYETGVDHGVLYLPDGAGAYDTGVAWNGLTTVTEKPTGAAATPQWADNIKYLNLIAREEFGATVQAFTYPDEFAECDGTSEPSPGVSIHQQARKQFGLCYRSLLGNDTDGDDHGYKLHLVYGATATPSEKAYATVNDSPAAIQFSWDLTTIPVAVTGHKPSSLLVIDSTQVDATALASLEALLYGDASGDARLPLPDEVLALFSGSATVVDMNLNANQPTFNNATGVVTLPAVAGVQWKVNGVNRAAGAQPAIAIGDSAEVDATPLAGNTLEGDTDWTFERS